jgi:PAS domain S-box-containing protein
MSEQAPAPPSAVQQLIRRLAPAGWRPWLLAGLGLLALHAGNPLAWRHPLPEWWFPPVGVGLVLVAWLGPWAVLLLFADILLVAVQARLVGTLTIWGHGWLGVVGPVIEAGILSAEVLAAWGCYYTIGRGSRRLADPRSATLFLVLVPTLAAGAFALLLALAGWALDTKSSGLLRWLGLFWLSHALGFLAVAPPLLAALTPWLVRHHAARPDPPARAADSEEPRRLTRGAIAEIAFMALLLAALSLRDVAVSIQPLKAGLQMWGLPMLVIVWASLRHGQRGGTIVASSAVCAPLLVGGLFLPPGSSDPFQELFNLSDPFRPILQANLLAECSTALLAAAAFNWVRLSEARYREVVTRIPVVLYSARVRQPGDGRMPPLVDVIFVSPAARDVFDAEPSTLLGDYTSWLARVHPADREVLLAAVAQLAREPRPITCEYRLIAADDGEKEASSSSVLRLPATTRWVRDTLAPQYGRGWQLEGWDGVLSDITEQRELADDLRRTTSMFHALVANLPAGVFFVQGQAGLPILVNARARHLLGQREDPGAGLSQLVPVYRLCRPDGTPYPTDELPVAAALRRGVTGMRDDIVVHQPDGQRLPLVTWAAPIDLGGKGQHDAAVWVFEDLSALRQAEAARRESEARLRTIIETMAEGLIVLDDRAAILECNPAACAILGRGADELRGRSFLDPSWSCVGEDGAPLPPEHHPALLSLRQHQPVSNVVVGIPGRVDSGQWIVDRQENSSRPTAHYPRPTMRWLLVNAMPLTVPRPQQKAARVVVTFADVTEHRRALEVVRASEEKYRELVETLPIALIQFDADRRTAYVNPAAKDTTGYGPQEMRAFADWEAIVNPADAPPLRAAYARAFDGTTQRIELRYRARDGSEKVGYVLLEPRRHDGRRAGVTALVVDVTRERQLEADLQRAQRLELIGRLASGIAHDFNNLLTVVLTLAELARNSLPEDHPTRDDLRRISYAGEQAANLAHQLLAFSKQRRAAPKRIDVNRVAGRTLELLRATLPKAIHIEPTLAAGELPVQADEMQVQQVLMNLCLNARDAMPRGGRLQVRTEAVDSGQRTVDRKDGDGNGSSLPTAHGPLPTGKWVRLSVQDNGEGIPEDLQGRIFDAFFSTKERGTGLGLAMVRQIVEGFGGHVAVSSRPGEGARFDVWLPRETDGQPAQPPGSSGTGRLSGEVGSMPT